MLEGCIISEIPKTLKAPANSACNSLTNRVRSTQTAGETFQINSTKHYLPVVTLSENDKIKFLKSINIKHKSKNLNYMVDPTFRNINRLFVFSFKNGNNVPTRNYFDKYYMSLVKIKE